MKSRLFRIPLLVCLLLLLPGCASLVKPRQSSSAVDELAALKQRVLELQRQVTVHDVEITRLKTQLAGRANSASQTRPESAPPVVLPREPEPPLVSARPSFEDEDLPTVEAPSPLSAPATPGAAWPEGEKALYELALTRFRERRYEDAETGFRKLLDRYPATDLSDNASYWLGESLYSRGEYQRAFEVFRQTVESYPDGNKLPDALLKVGLCLERNGDRIGARDVLEEVVRRFPATSASATATAALAALEAGG